MGGITTIKKAVTLIEVVLALAVFGIGILAILRLLTENTWWIYDIKSRDTAVLLAKEGLEIAYHVRDSNKEKEMYRDCARIAMSGQSITCADFFYEGGSGGTHYVISWDMHGTGSYQLSGIVSTGDETTRLYLHRENITNAGGNVLVTGGVWYDYNPIGGSPSSYTRYLRFTPVDGYETGTGLVLKVESHVGYVRGGRERGVVLESIIGEIR